MNLINIILILIIIIFLINYFSNGCVITTLKRIYKSCIISKEPFTNKELVCYKDNIVNVPFAEQQDFPYINNSNLDKETYEIYEFINSIITKNTNIYELTSSSSKRIKVNNNVQNEILNKLSSLFNKNYSFNNIKLNQDIYYYDNHRGKELEPFIFTADIMNNNKFINNYTFLINCFLRYDVKNNLLSITNLKIIKKNILHENTISPFIKNNNLNETFIKSSKKVSFENNDTDNSLIPSIDDISI